MREFPAILKQEWETRTGLNTQIMVNCVHHRHDTFSLWPHFAVEISMKIRFILVLFVLAASSVTVSNAGTKPVSPATISPFACCDPCPPLCP